MNAEREIIEMLLDELGSDPKSPGARASRATALLIATQADSLRDARRPLAMSPTMKLILELIKAGDSPFKGARGRSEHGGRARALMALKRRGLAS
jgi:hypothetical protein